MTYLLFLCLVSLCVFIFLQKNRHLKTTLESKQICDDLTSKLEQLNRQKIEIENEFQAKTESFEKTRVQVEKEYQLKIELLEKNTKQFLIKIDNLKKYEAIVDAEEKSRKYW